MHHALNQKPLAIPKYSLGVALLRVSAYFQKDLAKEYLIESLENSNGQAAFTLSERILRKHGLSSQIVFKDALDAILAPCCIQLKCGQFVTVIRFDSNAALVDDGNANDGVRSIDRTVLAENFSGAAICVSESLDELERRVIKKPREGHWFWREILAQKSLFRDAVLGSLCANLLAACIALFTLQVYDRVIPHQSTATLWVLVAGVAVAIVIEAALRIARAHLLDASGRQLELRLSRFLFEKFLGARLSQQSLSPGSRVHALKEFSAVREFFTATSIGSAADIPFVIIFLILIFMIAGNLAFAILFAMGLIVLPSLFAQKKIAKLSEETLGASSAAGKLLIETAYSQENVKGNQAEGFYQKKWDDIVTLNAVKTTEQRILQAGLIHSAHAVQQAAYVIAITIGVFLVFAGDFTVGSIIAVSILSTRTLSPVTQLSSIVMRWQQVRASLSALEEIANSEQDAPDDREFLRRQIFDGAIDIENLQFAYANKSPTLTIPKLTLTHGEKIALLGVNGSGKSTLLKVVSGLYDFSDGALSIDGIDIRQLHPHDLRRNIAYLPQEVKLFAGTLRENLLFGGARFSETVILEALSFAGLRSLVQNDPRGLDLVIEDGGSGLSLGQRQCVGLARLYLQDPRIVLLDEPTASLDQNTERRIIANLREWLAVRTCILTTHRVQPLELVDRIAVLQNGKIVLDDGRDHALETLSVKTEYAPSILPEEERAHEAA